MFLVLLSYLAFFSIALPDSMLGVAWPAMSISFQQPISAAGLVPPVGVAATRGGPEGDPVGFIYSNVGPHLLSAVLARLAAPRRSHTRGASCSTRSESAANLRSRARWPNATTPTW